jgi:hypothetical protein
LLFAGAALNDATVSAEGNENAGADWYDATVSAKVSGEISGESSNRSFGATCTCRQ